MHKQIHFLYVALSCPNDTEHGPIVPLSLVDALQSHDWKIDYHQQVHHTLCVCECVCMCVLCVFLCRMHWNSFMCC